MTGVAVSGTLEARGIETILRYRFKKKALLEEARIHSSAHAVGAKVDNGRLAWLGDKVLDLVASDQLFNGSPQHDRHALTQARKALVGNAALMALAIRRKLPAGVILGPGEEKSGGRAKQSILAGFVEALIGAVYQDSDFRRASIVARRLMRDED